MNKKLKKPEDMAARAVKRFVLVGVGSCVIFSANLTDVDSPLPDLTNAFISKVAVITARLL